MNNLENLLKGFDKNKLADAMRKAEGLLKNEEIRKAFEASDKNELASFFSKLDSNNKNEILNAIFKSNNKGIMEILKKIKS